MKIGNYCTAPEHKIAVTSLRPRKVHPSTPDPESHLVPVLRLIPPLTFPSLSLSRGSHQVRLSFRTDIGGMSENQDNCFIWRHEPSGSFVIGVLDVSRTEASKTA